MASRSALLRCLLCVSFLTTLEADDLAPRSAYEGKPVVQVRFDPPTQPLAQTDLNRAVAFPQGTPADLDKIRTAIKRLYETGAYSGVEVDTEPSANGVTLIFRTNSQWFVGPVEVKGKVAAPPNSTQLVNSSRLDLGAPFAETDVDTAVSRLERLLKLNGLYRSTVTPQITRDPEHQQVSITFEVNSGKRARLTLPQIIGDTRIPPDEVARAAKFKEILFFPWKPATQESVQTGLDDIRSKYAKQDRLTASVATDHSDYLAAENRVRVTIRADGGPKVKINSEGAKVSKGNLNKYVPVFDEGTVNDDLLVAGARNLRDYFQNRGYFDVQVNYTSQQTNPDLQTITYAISLGTVHRVVKVDIKGNKLFQTDTVRERMYLQPKGFIRLRHGRYSQSFASRDEDAIEALYRDNGYRDCKVTTTVVDDYRGKKGDVAITLNIQEGAPYVVSNLTINGVTLKNKGAILGTLASTAGQPFSETSVAMDRDAILEAYQSQGYPSATFDYKATPDGEHGFSLVYTIKEGEPQYVRSVLVSGMHTTRHRLVDPLVSLHSGDPLSWTEMGNMQRRLYNLGVFDKVDMAIQNPDGDEEEKYVDFHLVEGHLYTIGIGLGAEIAKVGGSAASVNPTGVTGFAPEGELQLSRLNMWGLGHSITFDGRYSTLDRRASISYSAPRFHNVDGRNITVTGTYDNLRDVLTFTAVKLEGSVQLTQKVNKATNLLFRYSWTDDQIAKNTLKIDPLLIPLYSQPSQVGMFDVNLVQDRRDDASDAHRGFYNSIDAGIANSGLGGNRNFGRVLLRNSYYKQIKHSYVLASNTEFGLITPFHTGGIATAQYIPLPERFFSGGESSLRAFATNQAGPRDPVTGFPLGGNALLLHTTEFRFPFIGDNIGGVLFHDMGNVYSSIGAVSFRVHQNDVTDFNYMVHAAGFGIRYRTPLGPLRVDIAYAINPPSFYGLQGTYQQLLFGGATRTLTNSGHLQFFFSVGQAF